ncbi:MAG: L-glutamate gamma-semialdehyde dehydrogenase [Elusimicrobiota bacterium]
MNARFQVPTPINEPILGYAPGSPERKAFSARLAELKSQQPDIPLYIGSKEVRTRKTAQCRAPHDQSQVLGCYHMGGPAEIRAAIQAALSARRAWSAMPFEDRAAIFLKAADLLANDWRWTLNAATMLCQSKNVFQAEIDSACELIDFFRYNVQFAEQIYTSQPSSPRGVWNRLEHRPLEGFVFAVTPFNFTSIAGNLPTAPALMGNTVVWKPAASTVYTAHYIMQLLKAAGLPDGVINMVTGPSAMIGQTVFDSPEMAGVHFTGSTGVFHWMWQTVGANIKKYKGYPRLVGETGGKDFVFAHPSADPQAVAVALLRGAFEFQGQKCSAASRAYIPKSIYPKVKESLLAMLKTVRMGTPEDFTNFFNAVIDRPAYDNIKGYIDRAKKNRSCKIAAGGKCDDSQGFFISPTVIETTDPKSESMVEEIFGPVLTVYVYPDSKWGETLRLCDKGSAYALTGAIFARDRKAIIEASKALENAAGNFYINDKPTGAVVGQQPFGGARASGTNDKAGSYLNLVRWVSPRAIKETFDPPKDYRYPFLAAD